MHKRVGWGGGRGPAAGGASDQTTAAALGCRAAGPSWARGAPAAAAGSWLRRSPSCHLAPAPWRMPPPPRLRRKGRRRGRRGRGWRSGKAGRPRIGRIGVQEGRPAWPSALPMAAAAAAGRQRQRAPIRCADSAPAWAAAGPWLDPSPRPGGAAQPQAARWGSSSAPATQSSASLGGGRPASRSAALTSPAVVTRVAPSSRSSRSTAALLCVRVCRMMRCGADPQCPSLCPTFFAGSSRIVVSQRTCRGGPG